MIQISKKKNKNTSEILELLSPSAHCALLYKLSLCTIYLIMVIYICSKSILSMASYTMSGLRWIITIMIYTKAFDGE